MSVSLETRYRRLLGWYPEGWRSQNADVVLGTLMDAAESEGRQRPTLRESASLLAHGIGGRLDLRIGLVLAAAGTGAAIVAGLMQLAVWPMPSPWLSIAVLVLQMFLAPALIAVALTALLRDCGAIGALRAVLVAALFVTSTASVLALALLWREAFAAAEAGAPTANTAVVVAVAVLAWATGAAAIAGVIESGLSRLGTSRLDRWGFSILLGVIVAPALVVSTLSAAPSVVAGSATLALVLIERDRRVRPAAASRASIAPSRTLTGGARVSAIVLSWAAFGMGVVAIVAAVSAQSWPGSTLDATQALQLGIAGGFLSALLLSFAAAAAVAARSRGRAPGRLVSIGVGALGLAIAGATSLPLVDAGSPIRWAGLLAALACGGIVLAMFVHHVVRGSRAMRSGLAVASGAGYIVTLGLAVTFASAFLAPVVSLIFAIRMARRTPGSAQGAPA